MLELGAIVFMVFVVWAAVAAGMVVLKFLLTVLLPAVADSPLHPVASVYFC